MHRMYNQNEDLFYYITVMNENYQHPAMPENVEEDIIKGMYLLKKPNKAKAQIQLLGSGAILREVIAAADLLEEDFGISANIWSITSFNELRREGLSVKRLNLLNPDKKQKLSYVESAFKNDDIPVVAATDYMKIFADQIREFIPNKYIVLGTDGFGRSDTRSQLRKFFEVNRYYIVVASLKALAEEGKLSTDKINEAIKKYNIDQNKPEPTSI
jgi:pyruvate dehydrogenase E1 component